MLIERDCLRLQVFGNGPVEIMTSNALLLLELMGRSDVSTHATPTTT